MIVTIQIDTDKDDKDQIGQMLRAQDLVFACSEFDNQLRKMLKYPTPEQAANHEVIDEIRRLFGELTDGMLP